MKHGKSRLEYLISLHAVDTKSSFEGVEENSSKSVLWEI